jgi:hypothetical protein
LLAFYSSLRRGLHETDTGMIATWATEAGLSVSTVTKWLKDPYFKDALRQDLQTTLLLDMPAVLQASIAAAKDGSFNDRKMLLEMAQLYVPRSKTEVTGEGGGPIQINIDQVMQMLENRTAKEGEVVEVKKVALLSGVACKGQ